MKHQLRVTAAIVLILFIGLDLCGCAGLKKKFTRKKKEVALTPYYELETYSKEPNSVLYKRHYVYWQTWQEELINKLEEQNTKKNMSCAAGIISNLGDMQRYLQPEKGAELAPFIEEMEGIKKQLEAKYLGLGSQNRLRSILEKRYRKIKREFSYKNVKDYIVGDKAEDAAESME